MTPQPKPVAKKSTQTPKSVTIIKPSNYKGLVLEKNNKLFINCKSEPEFAEYVGAASDVLRRQLHRDGFWQIVDNPQDAHFSINCNISAKRGEKMQLSISSSLTGEEKILGSAKTPEDINECRKLAWELYNKNILPLQRKIESGNVPGQIKKKFFIDLSH